MRVFAICRVRIIVNLASFSQNGVYLFVTFQRVKIFFEVHLQNNVFRILLVLNEFSKNMCCDFSSTTCFAAELCTMEIRRWSVVKELTYFEHIRRRVFPIAIGRLPPSFYRRPISLAPKKKGLKPFAKQGLCPLRRFSVRLLASGGTRCLWARCPSPKGLRTTGSQVGLVLPKTQRGRS